MVIKSNKKLVEEVDNTTAEKNSFLKDVEKLDADGSKKDVISAYSDAIKDSESDKEKLDPKEDGKLVFQETEVQIPSGKQWQLMAEKVLEKKNAREEVSLEDELDYHFNAAVQSNLGNFDNIRELGAQKTNLLIVGEPGGGKTSMIMDWAHSRGITLLKITGTQLNKIMMQGIPTDQIEKDGNDKEYHYIKYLHAKEFDKLDDADATATVLFVDEINRFDPEAEAALLSLVQEGEIPSDVDGEQKKFRKFICTIAACNPIDADSAQTGAMKKFSDALQTRFTTLYWNSSPKVTYEYLQKRLKQRQRILQRQLDAGLSGDKTRDWLLSFNESAMEQDMKKYEIIEALKKYGKNGFMFSDPTDKDVNDIGADDVKDHGIEASHQSKTVTSVYGMKYQLNARTLANCLNKCNGTVGYKIGETAGGVPIYSFGSFLGFFPFCCDPRGTTIRRIAQALAPLSQDERRDYLGAGSYGDARNARANTIFDKVRSYCKYHGIDMQQFVPNQN